LATDSFIQFVEDSAPNPGDGFLWSGDVVADLGAFI